MEMILSGKVLKSDRRELHNQVQVIISLSL